MKTKIEKINSSKKQRKSSKKQRKNSKKSKKMTYGGVENSINHDIDLEDVGADIIFGGEDDQTKIKDFVEKCKKDKTSAIIIKVLDSKKKIYLFKRNHQFYQFLSNCVVYPCYQANGYYITDNSDFLIDDNVGPGKVNVRENIPLYSMKQLINRNIIIPQEMFDSYLNSMSQYLYAPLFISKSDTSYSSIAKLPFRRGQSNLHCNPVGEREYVWGIDQLDSSMLNNIELREVNQEAHTQESLRPAIQAYLVNETQAIKAYGNIENWNVSQVTDMSYMFDNAENFNQNIGGWNVSNVENMEFMFNNAKNFNQNIGGWNVSNVENMFCMFVNASNFNQDIRGWNVSKVTSMSSMFYLANNFNQDIGRWNVSKEIKNTMFDE